MMYLARLGQYGHSPALGPDTQQPVTSHCICAAASQEFVSSDQKHALQTFE